MQSEVRSPFPELEPLLRALEVSSDSIDIEDIEGTILFVNDAWRRLFDSRKQDVVGASCEALELGDANNAELYASLARCVAYGYSEGAFRLKRPYGFSFTVFYTRALHKSADETPLAVITIYRTLASTLSVHRLPPLLISALNRSTYGTLIVDAFGYPISANEVFFELSGYSKEELPGINLRSLFANADEVLSLVDKGCNRWDGRKDMTRKNGSVVSLSMSITPARDTHEATVGFVVRVKPVLRETAAVEEPVDSVAQSKTRDQELRGLLKAIYSNVEIMNGTVADESLRHRLDLIRRAVGSGLDLLG